MSIPKKHNPQNLSAVRQTLLSAFMRDRQHLTIAELSKRSGVGAATIRNMALSGALGEFADERGKPVKLPNGNWRMHQSFEISKDCLATLLTLAGGYTA